MLSSGWKCVLERADWGLKGDSRGRICEKYPKIQWQGWQKKTWNSGWGKKLFVSRSLVIFWRKNPKNLIEYSWEVKIEPHCDNLVRYLLEKCKILGDLETFLGLFLLCNVCSGEVRFWNFFRNERHCLEFLAQKKRLSISAQKFHYLSQLRHFVLIKLISTLSDWMFCCLIYWLLSFCFVCRNPKEEEGIPGIWYYCVYLWFRDSIFCGNYITCRRKRLWQKVFCEKKCLGGVFREFAINSESSKCNKSGCIKCGEKGEKKKSVTWGLHTENLWKWVKESLWECSEIVQQWPTIVQEIWMAS